MRTSKYRAINISSFIAITLLSGLLSGCVDGDVVEHDGQKQELNNTMSQDTQAAIAINFGGEAYTGVDGTQYQADTMQLDAEKKRIEHKIKGSQDPALFESYRLGNLDMSFPLENGIYDITFKFAEPEDIPVGQRVFNVLAQGDVVMEGMDVRLARDGNFGADLVRTVSGVIVKNGQLDISFDAKAGIPIISALIVHRSKVDESRWKLVWQDEFEYEGKPDPEKWNYDIWPARKVNDEDQTYTNRLKNARVENGSLIIEAHKEDYDDAKYTSARLHNMGKADILYGKIEVRAKLPAGQGTWSAIWMLPSDPYKYATTCAPGEDWQGSSTCDAWPNSGEIDIMEHVGYDMQTVHGTVHTKAYYWVNGEQRKGSVEGKTVDKAFHLYSVEWTPEYIVIYFDNTPYFYYKNEGSGWQAWPFDHPHHLILNLAIGGAWGRAGGPIDDSIFPAKMEIDYVRVYEAVNNSK